MKLQLQLTIDGKSKNVNLEELKEILGIKDIEKKLSKPNKPKKNIKKDGE